MKDEDYGESQQKKSESSAPRRSSSAPARRRRSWFSTSSRACASSRRSTPFTSAPSAWRRWSKRCCVRRSRTRTYVSQEQGLDVDVDNLYVRTAVANEGPRMKRIRPAPMGRAFRYQRRLAHIIVTVAEKKSPLRSAAAAESTPAPAAKKTSRKAATKTAAKPAAKKAAAKKAAAKKAAQRRRPRSKPSFL